DPGRFRREGGKAGRPVEEVAPGHVLSRGQGADRGAARQTARTGANRRPVQEEAGRGRQGISRPPARAAVALEPCVCQRPAVFLSLNKSPGRAEGAGERKTAGIDTNLWRGGTASACHRLCPSEGGSPWPRQAKEVGGTSARRRWMSTYEQER